MGIDLHSPNTKAREKNELFATMPGADGHSFPRTSRRDKSLHTFNEQFLQTAPPESFAERPRGVERPPQNLVPIPEAVFVPKTRRRNNPGPRTDIMPNKVASHCRSSCDTPWRSSIVPLAGRGTPTRSPEARCGVEKKERSEAGPDPPTLTPRRRQPNTNPRVSPTGAAWSKYRHGPWDAAGPAPVNWDAG